MKTVASEAVADEPSDWVLLAEFTDRNSTRAFAELMKRHAGLVLSTCQRMLGCGLDSEDAAQAVFILMWQHAKKLSRHSSVAGWLHTTACNVCRNTQRARAVRLKHEREAAKMSTKSIDPSKAVWLELHEILDGELELLPAKLRTPLILFHLEGRELKEIAAELKVSISTVGTWLTRGREALAARLKRRGVSIGAAVLGGLLTEHALAAQVPLQFVEQTIQVAVKVGKEAVEIGGPLNSELLHPKSRSLFLSKSFFVCVAAVVLISALSLALMRPIIETRQSPDFPLLQGTWKETAEEREGGSLVVENPVEHTNWLIISGRNFKRVQEVPDQKRIVSESGAILLKEDGEPKRIDFRMWPGSVLGIYEVDGDWLTLCVGEPVPIGQTSNAKSRPDDFLTVKGDGRRLTRYERVR